MSRPTANRRRSRSGGFVAALVLLALACGKPAPPPAPAKTTADKLAFTSPGGAAQLTVWREPNRVRIEALDGAETRRISGLEVGRERRYQNPRTALLKARERKPGELLLLDPGGEAVWRLRITSDSVRIARGDRTGEPFFLAINELGCVAARRGTKSFGSVVPGPGTKRLRARRADGTFVLEAPDEVSPFALAVLLLEDLPIEERLIVFAELLRR